MSEPSDYSRHLEASLVLARAGEIFSGLRRMQWALEKLARPDVPTESGDYEAAAASMARDLDEMDRKLSAVHRAATEEFKRILAGEPAPKPFRREPLRLVKEEAADALE